MTQQHPEADYESREERLTAFIEDHDVLAESEPHQAVFLLGGLVGRITALQRHPDKDVSSTLVRRYPIDYLAKQTVKEVTKEVLQMNNTYIEADDELPSTYNARYVNLLPDMMLDSDPSSWKFSQNELQWIYSLGIAYGSNDTSINSEEEE
jgi:CRISPR-associated protein Cas8b/Csh1 subtype I-B